MDKPICIYHGSCDDGFGAAWCVSKALGHGNVELYPGVYNRPPPDVEGRDVIFVDFSYKRPILDEMVKTARSILILDHHKTAADDLKGFGPPAKTWDKHLECVKASGPVAVALFDMGRSGAGIAWDYFHPHGPRPLFVDYLEDRDLWRKKLPEGDQFTFALRSHPQTLDAWDALFSHYTSSTRGRIDVEKLIVDGYPITRAYRRMVEAIKLEAYDAHMRGPEDGSKASIRACNTPYAFASEVAGEIITDGAEFGVAYFRRADGRFQYSLRSRNGGADVSKVALHFGGGGHVAAAGFDSIAPVHTRSLTT